MMTAEVFRRASVRPLTRIFSKSTQARVEEACLQVILKTIACRQASSSGECRVPGGFIAGVTLQAFFQS
jgi:hypothetical protein